MLSELIKEAQNSNQQAMMELITRFQPVFKKYSKRLKYEDALYDLIADFIELILGISLDNLNTASDGVIVNYITTSTYRHYLKRLHKVLFSEPNYVLFEDLPTGISDKITVDHSTQLEFHLSECIPSGVLTRKEEYIIIEYYQNDRTVASLANELKVSRQNVNQIKLNAERKLREFFSLHLDY